MKKKDFEKLREKVNAIDDFNVIDARYLELVENWNYKDNFCESNNNATTEMNLLMKRKNELIIEHNKTKNIYFHENKWVYDLFLELKAPIELTGHELTKWFANEINKIDGVVVAEADGGGYGVHIITPYKVYNYYLNRGYAHSCTLVKGYNTKPNSVIVDKQSDLWKICYCDEELHNKHILDK